MTFWGVLSKLTKESERDLKRRFTRARSLIKGSESARDHLEHKDAALSGRIFVITTWRTGKGEEDFSHILQRQHHKITKIIRINWLKYSERALVQAIREHNRSFRPGDIVAIVRGGGDTKEKQFTPFNNLDAVEAVRVLREQSKVVVVTGVGHSSDHFAIEKEATFRRATPTDAAYLVCELLHEETWAEPSVQGQHTPRESQPEYQSNNDWWERHQKRRALEQKAREAEIREREKRRLYLEERETYYRSITEKELENQWNQREEIGLEPDETALLREIVREVKGIKPAYGNSAQVCRQCGMVGENCTCGRSWF